MGVESLRLYGMNVLCWFSGGITSAVACLIATQIYGKENCSIIMIDTLNEDEDTYRFMRDCEKLYGKKIKRITGITGVSDENIEFVDIGRTYTSIEDVWYQNKSLNVSSGAVCSSELKRRVRIAYQKQIEFDFQVFGFEFDKKEMNRALNMKLNHPDSKPIFPLLMYSHSKEECLSTILSLNIKPPDSYYNGFRNNNCQLTGCVQGGIGYWQKMKKDFPKKFYAMAEREHKLTQIKGEPVTMLKDQSKEADKSGNKLVFLVKNDKYPNFKSIDEMPECKVEPLNECNGFCGINDGIKNNTQYQINFSEE